MTWYRLRRPAPASDPYVLGRDNADPFVTDLADDADLVEAIDDIQACLVIPNMERSPAQRFAAGYRPVPHDGSVVDPVTPNPEVIDHPSAVPAMLEDDGDQQPFDTPGGNE